jgi:hypothetical protein
LEVQIVEKKYSDENEDSNIDKDINTSIDEDKDDSDVVYNKPFIIAFQKQLCQSFMFYYNTFFKFLIHHNCLLGHQL